MNNIMVSDNIKIENMIYEIRGKQVMLDSDLAMLYGCKNGTKSLNLAVKRHINRFPERFMFQLTKEEYSSIYSRFQFETLNKNNQKQGLNIKYLPYVFTEQGVAMLSAILKTDVAEEISIKIMDAFVAMKNIINTSLIEQKYFNELTIKNTEDIKLLQESFDKLNTKESNSHIFYEGQIYDAYSLLIDILSKAKKEIIIIDNYAGKKLFDIIRNINVKVLRLDRPDVKDPDEYINKYGPERLKKCIEASIPLVEFKISKLEKNLDIDNLDSKINFLTGVAAILAGIDNTIERDIYVDRIAKKYNIGSGPILQEIEKRMKKSSNNDIVIDVQALNKKMQMVQNIRKRQEQYIVALLLTHDRAIQSEIFSKISVDDINDENTRNLYRYILELTRI